VLATTIILSLGIVTETGDWLLDYRVITLRLVVVDPVVLRSLFGYSFKDSANELAPDID
jgi:hypothetical protein